MFIVLDGIDGSGKGTQTKLLVKRLQDEGHNIEMVDFPQYGNWSAIFVEKYLRGELGSLDEIDPKQASLFYALDRFAAKKKMQEALEQGKIIISNRYVSASKGHQLGKIKDEEKQKEYLDWLNKLEYDTLGLPKPNRTLFLHMPAKVGQKLVEKKESREYLQGKSKDIHEADLNHLQDAENAFLFCVQHDTHEKWVRIECAKKNEPRPIQEIHEEVYTQVTTILKSGKEE